VARDLMSGEEWTFPERFIRAVRAPNGRKPTNHRLVLDGICWIACTGSPGRDLPEECGKWSSVYRQFRRWTLAGLWEPILEAPSPSRPDPPAVNAAGLPMRTEITAGQTSDYLGFDPVRADNLPEPSVLLADRSASGSAICQHDLAGIPGERPADAREMSLRLAASPCGAAVHRRFPVITG
jgi:hypothetical protein